MTSLLCALEKLCVSILWSVLIVHMGSEQNPYIEDVDDIIVLITEKSSMRCLVHPSLLALVDGFCDENCILSVLNGCSHILQKIWEIVRSYWRRCIVHGCKDHDHNSTAPSTGQRTIYIDQLGEWSFPERFYHLEQHQYHYDINVTMMPFVISRYFENTKLPAYLKLYWERFIGSYLSHPYPAIGTPLIDNDDFGNIGFLTVREGFVEPGETLFECGGGVNIHCCSRLTLQLDSFDGKYICVGSDEISTENHEELLTNIGGGEIISNPVSTSKKYLGGMYMITNVPNTCRFWNCQINVEDTGK